MHSMSAKRWGVRELTRYVRQMFETDYRLQDLEVEGEVSNFRIATSGHVYFTLKDSEAQLRCVMWSSDRLALNFEPGDGDQVIAQGYLGVYEAGGQYQLYCRSLTLAGAGGLFAQFEALKARLQAEGLFDLERKRALPAWPQTIGIVTSPGAAALQDVLNILRRRAPWTRIILSPTLVQGTEAATQIVEALQALDACDDVDVVLIVRGGGSIEDLWCFNEEAVVRAVAASRAPIVSGVGHEIDFTLTDFAADLRAPTPSAAAELATPITADDLRTRVILFRDSLLSSTKQQLTSSVETLGALKRQLAAGIPQSRVDSLRQHVDMLRERTYRMVVHQMRLQRTQLDGIRRTLQNAGPAQTLARGFAIVTSAAGTIVRDARQVQPGEPLTIRLARGTIRARADKSEAKRD
mgnify:CR=1 FL=1